MTNRKLTVGENGAFWKGVHEFESKTGALVVLGTRPKKGPFENKSHATQVAA